MSAQHAQSGVDAHSVTTYTGCTASNLMKIQRQLSPENPLNTQNFVMSCINELSEMCGGKTFAVSHAPHIPSAPSPSYAAALAALQADQAKKGRG